MSCLSITFFMQWILQEKPRIGINGAFARFMTCKSDTARVRYVIDGNIGTIAIDTKNPRNPSGCK